MCCFDCVAQIRRNAPRALGILCILPLNRRGEVRESLQFGDHPKADDRVGKSIDCQLPIRRHCRDGWQCPGWMSRMGVAMIKTGLHRVDQLSSSAKVRGFFGWTRRGSITLYEKLHEMKKAEEL